MVFIAYLFTLLDAQYWCVFSGARQSDVTNVFRKKSKDHCLSFYFTWWCYHIVYEKHDNEQLDASLSIYFVYNQNKYFSVQNYL